jgi:hypothetical protein
MSKVEFIYGKGGKKVLMARRYAETLRKLGHGTYADTGYQTRMLTAEAPVTAEILISDAVAAFAEEHGVDIKTVTGTGKDGRINKSDIEAIIKAQDLV